jgi:hypothetical protein
LATALGTLGQEVICSRSAKAALIFGIEDITRCHLVRGVRRFQIARVR